MDQRKKERLKSVPVEPSAIMPAILRRPSWPLFSFATSASAWPTGDPLRRNDRRLPRTGQRKKERLESVPVEPSAITPRTPRMPRGPWTFYVCERQPFVRPDNVSAVFPLCHSSCDDHVFAVPFFASATTLPFSPGTRIERRSQRTQFGEGAPSCNPGFGVGAPNSESHAWGGAGGTARSAPPR